MSEGTSSLSLTWTLDSEAALVARAAQAARQWVECDASWLLVGLVGELGAGKTTWVRGMLRELGYEGRVPSPTYTLLEQYDVEDLTVLHLDLYRLPDPVPDGSERAEELEALGIRDWFGRDGTWLLVEWPDRSATLAARCDVVLAIQCPGVAQQRTVTLTAQTGAGEVALRGLDAAS